MKGCSSHLPYVLKFRLTGPSRHSGELNGSCLSIQYDLKADASLCKYPLQAWSRSRAYLKTRALQLGATTVSKETKTKRNDLLRSYVCILQNSNYWPQSSLHRSLAHNSNYQLGYNVGSKLQNDRRKR